MFDIKSFFAQCKRVWQILRKPNKDEYKKTATVAAIGLGLIGVIGFIIAMILNVFRF
jgi:protein translocase SEC61 complex gamma subunit